MILLLKNPFYLLLESDCVTFCNIKGLCGHFLYYIKGVTYETNIIVFTLFHAIHVW